ncbi:MAG: HEAT repeat domain-containing protein [Planctomycetes bacterium]|nr:HEAT repeat domain-containing protein [Planctomycetota bacterium]
MHFIFISLFLTLVQDKQEIDKFLEDLQSEEKEKREIATDHLSTLWEDNSVLESLNSVLEKAREELDFEVIWATESIIDQINLKRLMGSILVNSIGHKTIKNIQKGDDTFILKYYQDWMKDKNKYGLLDDSRNKITIWVVKKLKTTEGRYSFVEFIKKNPDKNYSRGVTLLFKDEDENIRTAAAILIGDLEATEVSKEVALLFRDRKVNVRNSAIKTIVKLNASEFVELLVSMYIDPDVSVTQTASEAVACLGTKDTGKFLEPLLNNPNSFVVSRTIWTLGMLGCTEYAKKVASFLEDEAYTVIILDAIGNMQEKEYEDVVGKYLDSEVLLYRLSAIRTLCLLNSTKFLSKIAKFLTSNDLFLLSYACRALGKMQANQYTNTIAQLLDHSVPVVRASAALALADLKTNEYTDKISNFLDDKNAICKIYAMFALEKLNAKECSDKIKGLLKDKGSVQAFPDLTEPRTTPKTYTVKQVAQNVLKKWGKTK